MALSHGGRKAQSCNSRKGVEVDTHDDFDLEIRVETWDQKPEDEPRSETAFMCPTNVYECGTTWHRNTYCYD
jgi:hypothetical protein